MYQMSYKFSVSVNYCEKYNALELFFSRMKTFNRLTKKVFFWHRTNFEKFRSRNLSTMEAFMKKLKEKFKKMEDID